jgi:uncharacterized membrane protein
LEINKEQKKIEENSLISLRRLQTLTDCIFALSFVLLVVFIEKPPEGMETTEENIRKYLFGQRYIITAYLITFMNIAFYWFLSHNQSKYLRRSDGAHVWLTIISLMFIGLLPFSNALNVAFPESLTVHIFFSSVVFFVGLFFYLDCLYATRRDRLIDRFKDLDAVSELIVESLVQPVAAIVSLGGAFIGTFWWEFPFMFVPVAVFIINRLWKRIKV